jgi:hypothetical protein
MQHEMMRGNGKELGDESRRGAAMANGGMRANLYGGRELTLLIRIFFKNRLIYIHNNKKNYAYTKEKISILIP